MADKKEAILVGDVYTNIINPTSGKSENFKIVSTWYDGTPMNNSKVDGYLYRRKGAQYLRRVIDKDGELFLEKDTMAQMRALTTFEILLLKAGVYKGVKLNGYYVKNDTPAPIEYVLSTTSSADDGGSVIFVQDIKLEHKFSTEVDVRYFGAKGDGIQDDTDFIQKAIDVVGNIIISKTHKINPVDKNFPTSLFKGGLIPKSDSTMRFIKGEGMFIMDGTNANAYTFINATDVKNVTIYNPYIIGDVDTHIGDTGEDGYGIFIVDSENVSVYDGYVTKCWGDGYYTGSWTTGNKGGGLYNCIADDNRRQGLSIVSWVKGVVVGGDYRNTGQTKFTAPGYGIDIEPNNKGTDTIDVDLIGVSTTNNIRGGLQIVPGFMTHANYLKPTFNVRVNGYQSLNDGNNGALRFAYPSLSATGMQPNRVIDGLVSLSNIVIKESTSRGVDFSRWTEGAPDVVINNLYIENVNTLGSVATQENQCGFVIYMDSADSTYYTKTGKITVDGVNIVDNRPVPNMLVPIWCKSGTGQSTDNIVIKNVKTYGQKSTSNGAVVIANTKNALVKFDIPLKKSVSSDLVMINGNYSGYELSSTVNNIFTLPPANNSIGLEYIFTNPNGVVSQVKPDSTDVIGDIVGNLILRKNTDKVKLKSVGNGRWIITEQSSILSSSGFQVGFRNKNTILYSSAKPVTTTLPAGSEVLNSNNSVGQPMGWKYDGVNWNAFGFIGLGNASTTTKGLVSQSTYSADTATVASGDNPTKAEFDALLAEFRDFKTKSRTSGQSATS